MQRLENLFPNELYHSYVIEGNPAILPFELLKFFEDKNYIEKQSPDVLLQTYDSFTIENSKRVKEWHAEKGVSKGKHICIIGTKFINHDAERTLLKIIEEPSKDTHFFIIVPNSQILLDTILSRVHLIKIEEEKDKLDEKIAQDFLNSIKTKRIDIVSKIIDTHEEDVGSGGLRYTAIKLINELEAIIYKKWKSDKMNNELLFSLDELAKAREYLALPGSSTKMVLEHIALVL
jgi:DNA polymerase III delta prime subunit